MTNLLTQGNGGISLKAVVAIIVIFFGSVLIIDAQESFVAYGSTVHYRQPDSSQWRRVREEMGPKKSILQFEHNPIEDADGGETQPVIAIICEQVPESEDLISYSAKKRGLFPFDVKKVFGPPDGFIYPNSIGYEGEYDRGKIHRLLVAYMRHKGVGLQVICDSTHGVYGKVEADMRAFLRSITFDQQK